MARTPAHRRKKDPFARAQLAPRKHVDPGPLECIVDGCTEPRAGRGMCRAHYARLLRHGDPLIGPAVVHPKGQTAEEYLNSRIRKTAGCWEWIGPVTSRGYGQAVVNGRRLPAHRAVYEWLTGPIPNGLTLDHTCHTESTCPGGDGCPHRRCVNPDHLEPVTAGENTRRGRTTVAANIAKTTCPKGHPYSHTDKRGWRKCQVCERERTNSRRPSRCLGCICDRALCEADDTGGHCADVSCGACLHGCPDPDPRGCRYCRRMP